ncbi:MAG: TetR/AcrR family transcriptional regulator [Microthrixaceae bacterium]
MTIAPEAADPAPDADPNPDAGAAHVAGSAPWWAARQSRSTRRRPRADGLTIERIVDAAIQLVDAEGLGALTVRRLADDLGTGSASLYRHVASRDELLVLMVDRVIGEVVLPPPDLPGRQRVEQLSHELRRVLVGHEHLLPALTAAPLLGPNAQRGAELALTSALDVGYDPPEAVATVLALIDFVLGTVYFDTSSAGRSFAAARRVDDRRPDAPAADEVFAFGLETFLAGLEHRFGPGTDR